MLLRLYIGLCAVACIAAAMAQPPYMVYKPGSLDIFSSGSAFLALENKSSFYFQESDGNFVFYQNGAAPWASSAYSSACKTNSSACNLIFQTDGNFVAYETNSSGTYAYWETYTAEVYLGSGNYGTHLVLRHERPYVTVYNASGQSVYDTGAPVGADGGPRPSVPALPNGTKAPTQTTILLPSGNSNPKQYDTGSFYADSNPYPNDSGSGSSPGEPNSANMHSFSTSSALSTASSTLTKSTSSVSPTPKNTPSKGSSDALAIGLGCGLGIGLGLPLIILIWYILRKRSRHAPESPRQYYTPTSASQGQPEAHYHDDKGGPFVPAQGGYPQATFNPQSAGGQYTYSGTTMPSSLSALQTQTPHEIAERGTQGWGLRSEMP